jgi:hypothetical protein
MSQGRTRSSSGSRNVRGRRSIPPDDRRYLALVERGLAANPIVPPIALGKLGRVLARWAGNRERLAG